MGINDKVQVQLTYGFRDEEYIEVQGNNVFINQENDLVMVRMEFLPQLIESLQQILNRVQEDDS